MPSEIELSWLAGIVDGEGHIGIHPVKSGYHQLRISIANTDLGILKECARLLAELHIFFTTRTNKLYPNRKVCYCIEVNRIVEAKELCRVLKPFIHSEGKLQKLLEVEVFVHLRKDGKGPNTRKKVI